MKSAAQSHWQQVICVVMAVAVVGCAYPGVQDLRQNALTRTVIYDRSYEELAACTARGLDGEAWSIDGMVLPANGWRTIPGESAIEVFNVTNGIHTYLLTFQAVGDDDAQVNVMTRRDVNPYLGPSYVMDKVVTAMEACA
jgi:hypothetical protein